MAYSAAALELASQIESKLHRHFNRTAAKATNIQIFRACALLMRDRMTEAYEAPQKDRKSREVHYLSLEFLLGRSLEKNAFNLGILSTFKEALTLLGVELTDVIETEPDAGLGNGGLGRLAACYLESMTTLGISATGYSLCYEFGIFRQKIIDGEQVELPDPWLDVADVWLIPKMDETMSVSFGGHLVPYEEGGKTCYRVEGDTEVLAVPYDMPISGYKSENVNTLRLWRAKSPTALDMQLFMSGQYMRAIEQNAMAEVINKVLYPADDHMEGKLLRLRQQYFFVSATVQSIVKQHKAKYGRLSDLHDHHILQINDTHPTLVVPELMRILLDEEGMSWDQAWYVVTHSVAYTNHTVLAEALECWPQHIIEMLLPRIWKILCEINDRYVEMLWEIFRDEVRVSQCAVIWDGTVRMANLCLYACSAVNGVSALHSNILKQDIFKNQFSLWPGKFTNVTNGVDHRRWLAQINPRLHDFICQTLGDDSYLLKPEALLRLSAYSKDRAAIDKLAAIKRKNKEDLARWVQREQGVTIDPSSVFDVQIKRLHEYKRQLLSVLHILYLYNQLCDNPKAEMPSRTYLFGAKAASGYYMAKNIIRLIGSVAAHIDGDERVKGRLKVVFLENYRVSMAERLIPASEVSEQISTAGKEASGTGNMKFMMNGALTIGTLDGANVEIHELVGKENMFLFGLKADEVDKMRNEGYDPRSFVNHNPELGRILDQMSAGFSDGVSYDSIVKSLTIGWNGARPDPFFLLADFEAYCEAQKEIARAYKTKAKWNRMSLENIAQSGFFASDRSIGEYAKTIWHV